MNVYNSVNSQPPHISSRAIALTCAQLLLNGVDTHLPFKAFTLFRKAAEQGLAAAQNNLAICYYNGDGCADDFDEAVRYYQLAAEQGLLSAMTNLGECCLQADAERLERKGKPPQATTHTKSSSGGRSANPSGRSRKAAGKPGKAAAAAAAAVAFAAAEAEAAAAAAAPGTEEEVLLDAEMAFKWFKVSNGPSRTVVCVRVCVRAPNRIASVVRRRLR